MAKASVFPDPCGTAACKVNTDIHSKVNLASSPGSTDLFFYYMQKKSRAGSRAWE